MKEKIANLINEALLKSKINETAEIIVEVPASPENGDFSTNIALKIAKKYNTNPLDMAENIKTQIPLNKEIIKIEIRKPGFINFFVTKEYLIMNIDHVLQTKEEYGSSKIGQGKSINIEFVSANPTGILHLGNARGGSYGDSLARILKFSGFAVTKEYYINDAGNQINNLGLSIQARYFELCGIPSQMPKDGYFGEEVKIIAQGIYDQQKDKYVAKELDYFKELGTKEFLQKIIDVLKKFGIEYDVFTSEKDIYCRYPLAEIIKQLTTKGQTYEKDGAIWFKSSSYYDDKDRVLVKTDGSYTYVVPDIPYHMDKLNRGFNKVIDILGTDHHGYVSRLKSAIKAIGCDDQKVEIKLLQLVRLVANGEEVKMSKRTGNAVTLEELIDEVGINAARYYFVMRSLDSQMDFDLDLAKEKSNENPVYYVSYAYARICTILSSVEHENKATYETINEPEAYILLEKMYNFSEIVAEAAQKELPHLITNYVYDLANAFHAYYAKYRIISDDKAYTQDRLNMIKAIKITIYNALNLIGVVPPERM